MTRPQAIFWDTFSTVPVANKVSSAGGQGGRDKKKSPFGRILKNWFGNYSFLSACNPGTSHTYSWV